MNYMMKCNPQILCFAFLFNSVLRENVHCQTQKTKACMSFIVLITESTINENAIKKFPAIVHSVNDLNVKIFIHINKLLCLETEGLLQF